VTTDETSPQPDEEEALPETDEQEDDAMRSLLKRAMAPESTPAPEKPLLKEVQRKLRVRSKGKFYGDGWSTAAVKINYGLIAVVMLLVVALAYFALGPVGMSAK
jgi:hypothetical protein